MDWRRIGAAWGDFLLGSPRRTLIILGFGFGLYLLNNPTMITSGVNYLMEQVIVPLLQLAIMAAVLMWFVRRVRGGSSSPAGKKKK